MLATCSYSPPTGNVHCHKVWTYFWIQPGTWPAPALAIQSCHGLLTWIIGVFSEIDHQAMIAITDHYSNGQYCCRLPGLHCCTPNHDILVLPYCHWLPHQTYFDPIALLGLEFRAKNGRQLWAQCALRRSWGVETTLQFSRLKTSNTSGHVQQHRARALWAYSDVGKSPCHQFPRIGHGILSSLVGGFKHF
jgi:hypothetical protein